MTDTTIDSETLGTCRIAFDGIGSVPHPCNDECIDWVPLEGGEVA